LISTQVGPGALAALVRRDAFAASGAVMAVPRVDDPALARLCRDRPERGWFHGAFPELDADALAVDAALADGAASLAALAAAAHVLARVAAGRARAPRARGARLLAAAAAAALWDAAAARRLAAALRADDPALPADDDGAAPDESAALFAAAAALLEILAAAEPATAAARGAADAALAGDGGAWPDRGLSRALRDADAAMAAAPPDGAKVAQLLALARGLGDAGDLGVPVAAVAHLFGVAASGLGALLDLRAPPPDDAAVFGELAARRLAEARRDPAVADALRRAHASDASRELQHELEGLGAGAAAAPSSFAFSPGRDGAPPALFDAGAEEPQVLFDFKPKDDGEPQVLFDFKPKDDGEPQVMFDFKPKDDAADDDDW